MLYWLSLFSDQVNVLNLFRYLTVRTGGAMFTAGVFVFLFGPWFIDHLRVKQGKGQPIRTDGPQSHLGTKKGTPTMGGLINPDPKRGVEGKKRAVRVGRVR